MAEINKTHRIGRFDLRFFSKNPSWCQIYISEAPFSCEDYLGSDSLKIIKERLSGKIKKISELPSKVQIKDRNVCWIMSLMDGHSSIYLSKNPPFYFYILFNDKSADNPFEIALSHDDLDLFCEFIEKL